MSERYWCLEDMCDSRGGEECDRCKDSYDRGRAVGYANRRIEELQERKKYRWHDLKKDPEDLPNEGHEVIACYDYRVKDIRNYHVDYLDYGVWVMSEDYDMEYWTVIAWREIEPFEEASDDT